MDDEQVLLRRKCISLVVIGGLLQIVVYYLVGIMSTNGLSFPIAQPDTLMLCQSAKKIAEGFPFFFSSVSSVSTGITTHFYPFVLALPYALGAKGESLVTAGFWMNAVFYLVFLVNWSMIAWRMIPTSSGRIFAFVLLVLNGQAAYSAMAQSDIGFFMMISSGLLVSLLYEKWWSFGALLVLSPWCRPEGVPMAILFLLAIFCRCFLVKDKIGIKVWGIAIAGVVSAICVFFFNYYLTGDFQFQSVLNKGYFTLYSFGTAVYLSASDLLRMAKELFLGIPDRIPRMMYFLPLFGGFFAWLGVIVRPWQRETAWKEIWWILVSFSALGVVAISGWQNTNVDRYLGWVLPLWFIFMAQGLDYLFMRCTTKISQAILASFLIIFQIASSVLFVSLFSLSIRSSQAMSDSYQEIAMVIPSSSSVGGFGIGSYAYCHGLVHGSSELQLKNLTGIFFPPFLTKSPICNLERIKHNRKLSFDYWLFHDAAVELMGFNVKDLCPIAVVRTLNGESIRKTDWTLLDKAFIHEDQPNEWKKVDAIDVGYPEDEERCNYEEYCRLSGMTFYPFGYIFSNSTERIFEVGRAIIGYDSMTVEAQAGRSMLIVMRTVTGVSVPGELAGTVLLRGVELNSPLKIRVNVNEADVGVYEIPVEVTEGECIECNIEIPAKFITTEQPQITLYGDHIPLAYWFYQKAE